MNLLLDGIAWILDPANWTGVGSIPERIGQHLLISAVVLVIASIIALPAGVAVGHSGRGKEPAVMVSGGLRAPGEMDAGGDVDSAGGREQPTASIDTVTRAVVTIRNACTASGWPESRRALSRRCC